VSRRSLTTPLAQCMFWTGLVMGKWVTPVFETSMTTDVSCLAACWLLLLVMRLRRDG
jgi:hypothetical protein